MPDATAWQRISIGSIETLKDAVYGAGLEATQMSRGQLTGNLLFAERDGVLYSSGHIGGRVALLGPLSQECVTLGVGLDLAPGTRHWLTEVETGDMGVFGAGDEHDSLYEPGSLYATATLTYDRLEEIAARIGLVSTRACWAGPAWRSRNSFRASSLDFRRDFDGRIPPTAGECAGQPCSAARCSTCSFAGSAGRRGPRGR